MRRIAKVLLTLLIGLVLVLALSRYSQSTLAGHSDCVECHKPPGFIQGYPDSTHHDLHFGDGPLPCGYSDCHPISFTLVPPDDVCSGWTYETWGPCHVSVEK